MTKTTTELTVVERAAVALGTAEHEKNLLALVKQSESIIEIKNNAARAQCHSAYMVLRTARTGIQKAGKTAREDAAAFSKAVIEEEKRLIAITEAEETRLRGLRDEWDEAREAEKRAKVEAEARRIATLRARVDEIRAWVIDASGKSSVDIGDAIAALVAEPIDVEHFAEMTGDAELARGETIDKLRSMHSAALAQEAEARRVAEERAELERQRAALEAEQQRLAAERAEQDRIERARRDAEEAERREALAKADAIMRAERETHEARMSAERAELQRRQDEAAAEQRRAAAELQRQQDELAALRRAEADAAAAKQRAADAAAAKALREQLDAEAREIEKRQAAFAALQKAAPALLDACRQFIHASETSDAEELENAYQAALAAVAEAEQTETQPA